MSEQNETIFGEGFIFKRPHENAKDFVKGSMAVKVDEAIAFLQKYKKTDGWVNLDLLASKDNSKLYFKLNTWEKPEDSLTSTAPVNAGLDDREVPPLDDSSIPF